MAKPDIGERFIRLLHHDTSFVRMIVSLGLVLMGVSMLMNMGTGVAGYALMEEAAPLPAWGVAYFVVGLMGLYGCLDRLKYWVRVALPLIGMYLWAVITIAQFNDQPLPTRTLLILPAIVELWVLIKVAVCGRRKDC